MLKKILCALVSLISFQIYSMDQPVVCYLALMPIEVCNVIAQYAIDNEAEDNETEEEFITRTIPAKDKSDLFDEFFRKDVSLLVGIDKYCPSFSFDRKKIALIQVFSNKDILPRFTLFGLVADCQGEKKIIHSVELPSANYSALAISPLGNIFATIITKAINPTLNKYKKVSIIHELKVIKTTNNQQKIDHIPNHIDTVSALAFNKQGTHLIVHGTLKAQKDMKKTEKNLKPYWIYPLGPKNKEKDMDCKLDFQRYFMRKRVCKDIKKSLCNTKNTEKEH